MNKFLLLVFLFIYSISLFSQFPADLYLEEYASGFMLPTEITHAGDDRIFVCEKAGVIKIVNPDGTVLDDPFLDISDKVSSFAEQGLIGLAFHPDFENNGWFYLTYTDLDLYNNIVRFSIDANDPNKADLSSEKLILNINEEQFFHHLGGCLHFGPDGYLYISVGEAGLGWRSLELDSYLGKILRIDVDNGDPYSIPSDNPYVNTSYNEEIWASGLRNPWKFSFDANNGDFWVADVGEYEREEISGLPLDMVSGKSFGWPCFEGTFETTWTCDDSNFNEHISPSFEYGNDEFQSCRGSVTGGFVYRGMAPKMQDIDAYIYGDYCSGKIFATYLENVAYQTVELYHNPNVLDNISSFGQDQNGELLVADLVAGKIFKMDFNCRFPDIEIFVASCQEAQDGCIEITIPDNEGIISAEIYNDQNQLTLESDYCSLAAGNYRLSSMNETSSCTKDILFTIETYEPLFKVSNASCDIIEDGCIEISESQNVSENFSFRIEAEDGTLIDSASYCNLKSGKYFFILDNDSASCFEEHEFVVYFDWNSLQVDLIDGILFAESGYQSYQWYFSDTSTYFSAFQEINGATNDFHIPETIGFYRCRGVGDDGCSDISLQEEVEMVSSNQDLNPIRETVIYPNPVLDNLNVKIDHNDSQKLSLSILNLNVQRIKNDSYLLKNQVEILSISIETLVSGTYFLELKGENFYEVLLFVKH